MEDVVHIHPSYRLSVLSYSRNSVVYCSRPMNKKNEKKLANGGHWYETTQSRAVEAGIIRNAKVKTRSIEQDKGNEAK